MTGIVLGLLALGLIAGSLAEWFRRVRRVAIPKDRRGFVATWIAGASLGILALSQGGGVVAGLPAGIAVVGGTVLCVLVLISPQKVGAHAIRVGEKLRDFEAMDEHGDGFSIASIAGKPVLLKFFRGHW